MAKFINDDHRSPNARAVLYRLESGNVMIALKSKTFIEKGQEIRYDYLHGNTTGDCPWRNVSFTSKIIQCSIEPQNTELDIKLVSETHFLCENLRESACQANEEETSHDEVSDDYITDPLYTSTSEVTLGTQDTESEVQATHKRSSESKHEAADSAHAVCAPFSGTPSRLQGGLQFWNEETSYDALKAICGFCQKEFFNQKAIVEHFLLQQCQKKFVYIDPMHIPGYCCTLCNTLFLTSVLFVVRKHIQTQHFENPQIETEKRKGNYYSLCFDDDVIRNVMRDHGIVEVHFDDESLQSSNEDYCSPAENCEEPVKKKKVAAVKKGVKAASGSTSPQPRKPAHETECKLCGKTLQNHLCLPKHLRRFHESANEKFINAIVKLHYFEKKKKGTTKCIYICLKENCLKVFHRKDKHNIADHLPCVKAIRKVSDLPEFILGGSSAKAKDDLDVHIEALSGFNFQQYLKLWVEEKRIDYDDGKGQRRYAADRLPGLVKKIKVFLVMTDGLSDATVIAPYFLKLKNEMKVKAGQSMAQICRELRDFVEFCRLGCPSSVIGFNVKCDQVLRGLQRQISKANKETPCRLAANHEFTVATIATVEEIDEVFRIILSFMYKTLYFFERLESGSFTSWVHKTYNGTKYTKL